MGVYAKFINAMSLTVWKYSHNIFTLSARSRLSKTGNNNDFKCKSLNVLNPIKQKSY